jgi:hypothetical protein
MGPWAGIDMGWPASTATLDTLIMGKEMVPETSASFYHFTWPIAQEDFIDLVNRESFRSYK